MNYTKEINGHTVEFIQDGHIYLVDGIIVPSVSEILSVRFGKEYQYVKPSVLERSAEQGTIVHDAIERYCRYGEETELPEVRNFKFLQKRYGFRVLENEVPVTISEDGVPVAVGRLDMVLEMDGKIGGADIKRTSALNKERLGYQLNLYRIGYRQTYGKEWEFLKGIHLREDTRKFVDIPINERLAWDLIHEYKEKKYE